MATDKFINGHYSFDGYTTTRIIFDNATQVWKMELLSDPSIYATTEMVPVEYPLGTHVWDVEAPAYKGDLELNLNSCDDFDSFGCNDGDCITIEERFFRPIPTNPDIILPLFSSDAMGTMTAMTHLTRSIATRSPSSRHTKGVSLHNQWVPRP